MGTASQPDALGGGWECGKGGDSFENTQRRGLSGWVGVSSYILGDAGPVNGTFLMPADMCETGCDTYYR